MTDLFSRPNHAMIWAFPSLLATSLLDAASRGCAIYCRAHGHKRKKIAFICKTFAPNHKIFDEGDPTDSIYILRCGAVEIRIGTRGENPRTLTKIKVGDVFGDLALLENRPREAAAIALENSEVLVVPPEEFIKRLNASDPVMKSVVIHLVSRLRELTDELKKRGNTGG